MLLNHTDIDVNLQKHDGWTLLAIVTRYCSEEKVNDFIKIIKSHHTFKKKHEI